MQTVVRKIVCLQQVLPDRIRLRTLDGYNAGQLTLLYLLLEVLQQGTDSGHYHIDGYRIESTARDDDVGASF